MAEKEYIEREAAIAEVTMMAEDRRIPVDSYGGEIVGEVIRLLRGIPAADVRPVVTCSDCKWWTKQESSLQGRCELLQMYPTGAWFCANGKREES